MNIRKTLCLLMCFFTLFTFSGCGGDKGKEAAKEPKSTAEATKKTKPDEEETKPEKQESQKTNAGDIDVDLTALSSTMAYSEVYNMMTEPEDYIGKTVRMKGSFAACHDDKKDKYYYACIAKDAAACCSQAIEFELAGDHKYPDDYPKEGEEICVVGTFDKYKDGKYTYCVLRNASFQ